MKLVVLLSVISVAFAIQTSISTKIRNTQSNVVIKSTGYQAPLYIVREGNEVYTNFGSYNLSSN